MLCTICRRKGARRRRQAGIRACSRKVGTAWRRKEKENESKRAENVARRLDVETWPGHNSITQSPSSSVAERGRRRVEGKSNDGRSWIRLAILLSSASRQWAISESPSTCGNHAFDRHIPPALPATRSITESYLRLRFFDGSTRVSRIRDTLHKSGTWMDGSIGQRIVQRSPR